MPVPGECSVLALWLRAGKSDRRRSAPKQDWDVHLSAGEHRNRRYSTAFARSDSHLIPLSHGTPAQEARISRAGVAFSALAPEPTQSSLPWRHRLRRAPGLEIVDGRGAFTKRRVYLAPLWRSFLPALFCSCVRWRTDGQNGIS